MITPVLMCGGSGTRLWPLSRKSYPKQFAPLLGDESLFQASALRFAGPGFAAPLILTAEAFRFVVGEQLGAIGVQPAGILIEPEGRNTAPAAAVAALYLAAQDPDAMMMLAPADHAIAEPDRFRDAVIAATPAAHAGQIVTFGIAPDRPETGYGWLEPGATDHPGTETLIRFIEKPDLANARTLLAGGRCLWNAGVFLARADVMIAAFRAHAPAILDAAQAALDAARRDLDFMRLDAAAWAKVPEDSIDYAVMEKAGNLSVRRYDGAWSDLGDWQSVWRDSPSDGDGNALAGPALALGCHDTLLRSEHPDIQLVGIGLTDIVAIAMRDAVLVVDRNRCQDVKGAVTALRRAGVTQAEQLPVDHRPWGWFETLVLGDRFQVKRIHVHPGAALSLQSHVHRSEHWIVVEGTARVTVDDQVRLVTENQSVYIPLGARHRMENPGKVPMVLIEVQTGSYLGEDDITRYEDIYARG